MTHMSIEQPVRQMVGSGGAGTAHGRPGPCGARSLPFQMCGWWWRLCALQGAGGAHLRPPAACVRGREFWPNVPRCAGARRLETASTRARQWAPVMAVYWALLCEHVQLFPCAGCGATAGAAAFMHVGDRSWAGAAMQSARRRAGADSRSCAPARPALGATMRATLQVLRMLAWHRGHRQE